VKNKVRKPNIQLKEVDQRPVAPASMSTKKEF
jgi:hypothetical protein